MLSLWETGSGGVSLIINELLSKFSLPNNSFMNTHASVPSSQNLSSYQIHKCLTKASNGQFKAALKFLTNEGLAPLSSSTFQSLVSLHPVCPPPSSPPLSNTQFPNIFCDTSSIIRALHSFSKDSAPGCDGLRSQHLLDFIRGDASSLFSPLLSSLHSFLLLLLGGHCPLSLTPYLSSAPLTALQKRGGGVRPIAVGLVWRRLASKLALRAVINEARQFLAYCQFGVGFPGGAEAIIHSANRFLQSHSTSLNYTIATIDFKNAFNSINRNLIFDSISSNFPVLLPWVLSTYGSPARLYFNGQFLLSHTGVQQGDPLGPLLFSLGLHSILSRLRNSIPLPFMAWYLDDGTLIGPTKDVSLAIKFLLQESSLSGLSLNISKTELFWPTPDPMWHDFSAFPGDFSCRMDGIPLLGSGVSLEPSFFSTIVSSRVEKSLVMAKKLSMLKDPHVELLLLRSCLGTPKMVYSALQTSPPSSISSC